MVALSSAAIAAVYFAGLAATREAAAGLAGGAATSAPLSRAAPQPSATPTVVPPIQASRTASSGAATSSSSYADGTYSGTGTSRFGSISVSVTIQSGRITNVAITRATTSFPVSRIASLPGQVVARQSAQVDRVTGATYSSQAFRQAVQQALSQAVRA
jgi:uncharacterized protein with FMN-binding domain